MAMRWRESSYSLHDWTRFRVIGLTIVIVGLQYANGAFAAQHAERDSALPAAQGFGLQPFLALEDPVTAHSDDVQRLYQQAGAVSSLAYLLLAAAEPLAKAPGSSKALLPYLDPNTLRAYASMPGRCASPLVAQLYELARLLHGRGSDQAHQACHASLLGALHSVFAWVRDSTELSLQEVPGQPTAAAAWPSPGPRLTALLAAALSSEREGQLGPTGRLVGIACGLNRTAFAAAVMEVADALTGLHADLATLQQLARAQDRRYEPEAGAEAEQGQGQGQQPSGRRRSLGAAVPPNFYAQYPKGFTVKPPSETPRLLVPLVFHIFLYRNNDSSVGPAGWQSAAAYAREAVRIVNTLATPGRIQFFVKEVRADPVKYPHLLLPSRQAWLNCWSPSCMGNETLVFTSVIDFPRSINVFIVTDTTASGGTAGAAVVPGSDVKPSAGSVFVTWDGLDATALNSPLAFYAGPTTLLHELFHHLGVTHPFGSRNSAGDSCDMDDYNADTPITLGPAQTVFGWNTVQFCLELFWGRDGGSWDRALRRLSASVGIPTEDKNAWADSCPGNPGYDELGNYMTYSLPVCYIALGHMTPQQYQRAHYITSQVNPLLYAWGQFYAKTATTPPMMMPPAPSFGSWSKCKVTMGNCRCKASWTSDNTTYSYCAAGLQPNNMLWCEVESPASCGECRGVDGQCVMPCAGTAKMCGLPGYPGTYQPNPPLPPSPPPMPPPPPPRSVPSDCKVTESGCKCRALWSLKHKGLGYYSYCGFNQTFPEFPSYGRLLCQVEPDCPDWAPEFPYLPCKASLTASHCSVGAVGAGNGSAVPFKQSPAKRSPPPRRRSPPTGKKQL